MTPVSDNVSRTDGEGATTLSPSSAARGMVLEAVGPQDAKGFIVATPAPGVPAFEGRWDLDYTCGSCGRILCRSMKHGLFAGMIFRCIACNKLNRVPGGPARLSAFP